MKNKVGCCRTGITTSKKIGNAVKRNRSRRIIRAAYAELEGKIQGNWDFVFVARSATTRAKMSEVLEAMTQHFVSLGVINEED
jgi:ribonuclease P protein component